MNFIAELKERGFLYQISNEELLQSFEKGGESFYVGFDPSADSLHLGNFVGFMMAVHLMLLGNKYFCLIGGATGMIGDPSGKQSDRNFLDPETLNHNQNSIKNQVGGILENLKKLTGKELNFEMVNNKDFYEGMNFLDFLREAGKYMTVNKMISRENVKHRIEDPNLSISYTEFSYAMIQGYDFWYLYNKKGVRLQAGGSDQWGNIVTGLEIIDKKEENSTALAATWPLLIDSSGKKFGKSEGNAMFLDKNKTSPFAVYQYFINTSDEDVERFFKILTLLSLSEISEIISEHQKDLSQRLGQKRLAFEVVKIIHSINSAELCKKISEFMFGKEDKIQILSELNSSDFAELSKEIGTYKYENEDLFSLFKNSGLTTSNSNSRQELNSGSLYINEEKIIDSEIEISKYFGYKNFILIRKGKKNFKIVVR